MFTNDYYLMQVGVVHNATYKLDGRVCVIKKAAEDTRLGMVTCQFEDGTIKRRHYEFFNILDVSIHQTFRTV